MLKNRDIFLKDPTTYVLPNNGVAQVINPATNEEWKVLRYELAQFVCEGEYQRGLQLILATYLNNINETKQPAIWVSGFYGSGKSHFVGAAADWNWGVAAARRQSNAPLVFCHLGHVAAIVDRAAVPY